MFNTSLQINLAPNDYPHARHLLPYQIDVFIDQVDEVVLTLDTHRSKGRFGENWEENFARMGALLKDQCERNKKIRVAAVDYKPQMMKSVGDFFFGSRFMPRKDYRGGPFYAYFYGLFNCKYDYVLHLDSDMFFGGRSDVWLKEAVELLAVNNTLLTVSPLAGPPHPQNLIVGQPGVVRLEDAPYKFRFDEMSTRVFLINKSIFCHQKLSFRHPALANRLKAFLKGNGSYDLPERLISSFMRSNSLKRVDFLGTGTGMWSLHPPYRTEGFYNSLPILLKKIIDEDLPSAQYGFYDIVDELCDWKEAREKIQNNRWWKK